MTEESAEKTQAGDAVLKTGEIPDLDAPEPIKPWSDGEVRQAPYTGAHEPEAERCVDELIIAARRKLAKQGVAFEIRLRTHSEDESIEMGVGELSWYADEDLQSSPEHVERTHVSTAPEVPGTDYRRVAFIRV